MARYKNRRRYKKHANNYKKIVFLIFMFALCFCFISSRREKIVVPIENVQALRLSADNINKLKELSIKYEINFPELLTYYCLENNFFEKKIDIDDKLEQNLIMNYDKIKNIYANEDFDSYYNLLNNILEEIKTFPVNSDAIQYIYGDSWGADRTYGGKRIHQGCDIMDRENMRGKLEVVSMTDGTVSNLGWNEKGGWRVGINSESGNYYYYAHLDSFRTGLKKGEKVKAGDLIGYMGDSGYSKIEGTTGKFEVHLHIGICPKTDLSRDEIWINPYPFLRSIETLKE